MAAKRAHRLPLGLPGGSKSDSKGPAWTDADCRRPPLGSGIWGRSSMALTKHLRNKDSPVRVIFTQRLPNTRAPMNRNETWAPGEALVLPASEAGYPSDPTSPLATWDGDGGSAS